MKNSICISKLLCYLVGFILLSNSCSELPSNAKSTDEPPAIFPDYREVTIPVNIAPLNFRMESKTPCKVLFSFQAYSFVVSGSGSVDIPLNKWRELLSLAKGDKITVTVYSKEHENWLQHPPFHWYVSPDSIDNYLSYRLIEPTYANWNEMGIYQRDLTSFTEKEIIANDKTGHNCMNCHSFNQRNPKEMVLHMRKINPGTVLIKDGAAVKLDTRTDYTISNFVYPYWHPKGHDIAFSTNNTQMSFFEANSKLIEVYDLFSDIVMYNIDKNEVYTSPLLSSKDQLENFPVFSPDGKTLYFCTSPRVDSLPQNFDQVKYRLCSIGFDPDQQQFGMKVDTLIDLTAEGKGVSLPSIAPNGRYLLCSVATSGCFLSWDKESDLYLYDTMTKEFSSAGSLNSDNSDSYTNWSSDSHWVVFSSRRTDGVHNRPFIAHIDDNGKIGKPFILPQKDPDYYEFLFKAYNLPQFITGEVTISAHEIAKTVTSKNSERVKFRKDSHSSAVHNEADNKSEVN